MSNLQDLLKRVENHSCELNELSTEVWKNPELAFKEFIACKLQCDLLKKWGFKVEENYCGFETAYRCEYGSGSPAFAITSEYDALPGVGHGCGHNLICAAALGAFIALTEYMKANNIPGKVVLLGIALGKLTGVEYDAYSSRCKYERSIWMLLLISCYYDTGSEHLHAVLTHPVLANEPFAVSVCYHPVHT